VRKKIHAPENCPTPPFSPHLPTTQPATVKEIMVRPT